MHKDVSKMFLLKCECRIFLKVRFHKLMSTHFFKSVALQGHILSSIYFVRPLLVLTFYMSKIKLAHVFTPLHNTKQYLKLINIYVPSVPTEISHSENSELEHSYILRYLIFHIILVNI